MAHRAWKATLQNGLKVELDYNDDDDSVDVYVGVSGLYDIEWDQLLPEVEDRTPTNLDGDRLTIDRIWVATRDDGSQILVNYWHQTYFQATDQLTVAYRSDRWMSWWAPVTATDIDIKVGDS
jgi:hypothetical protein